MKKTLLSVSLLLVGAASIGQNVYSYGFDPNVNDLAADGWITQNSSSPSTATVWSIASYDEGDPTNPFGGAEPVGQDGVLNSFALVNYTSTSGTGTISNWLISPTVTGVQNGDVVTFYTRSGENSTDGTVDYADRLQLRMSVTGDASTVPAAGSSQLGSFTTLLADVNPNLTLTDYPTTWDNGLITATISGLSGPTDVKFAFRYFVTSGGPTGDNSDIIGIDTFSVDHPLSTSQFFTDNFRMYPNPATDVIHLSSATTTIDHITVTDLNGRSVQDVPVNALSEISVNISGLASGVYFAKVRSGLGVGTSKIIKK